MDYFDMIQDMLTDDDEPNVLGYNFEDSLKTLQHIHTVNSLSYYALHSVAANIDYWFEYIPKNASEYLYILSPFDILGTGNTLKILKLLVQQNKFKTQYLHLFLHNNLMEMDFKILANYSINDCYIKILFNRCKKIKSLTIPQRTKVSTTTMNLIPLQYPYIEHLRIEKPVCVYSFLSNLVDNCKCIKFLHLSSLNNLHNEELLKISNCRSLRSLSLNDAVNLACKSLQSILSSLQNLFELSLTSCKVNFCKLDRSKSYQNIKVLDISRSEISDLGLDIALSSMNAVVDLRVSNCKFLTTSCFRIMSKLVDLKYLNASYISGYPHLYSFDSNVEYCLLKIGGDLLSMDLSGMNNIKLDVIGHNCMNIRKLFLFDCHNVRFSWITGKTDLVGSSPTDKHSFLEICNCLESLVLTGTKMSIEELPIFFHSTSYLKTLHFTPSIHGVASELDFFMTLFKNFHFQCLTELNLSNSEGINRDMLLFILQLYPKLKKLKVANCNWTDHEITYLTAVIDKIKLDVEVEFKHAMKF